MVKSVLLMLLAVNVIAEPAGFLNIQCGAKRNQTDQNNKTWVTDANYIDVGEALYIGNDTGSHMHTLRFFPQPLNKSCYTLNVTPNVPQLLRLVFAAGNYSGIQQSPSSGIQQSPSSGIQQSPSFAFSIETLGLLAFGNVTAGESLHDPYVYETILVSSGRMLYICLIRTLKTYDPFISTIELRPLRDGMYAQAKSGTMLYLIRRIDVGGASKFGYPQDNFDRKWRIDINMNSNQGNVSEAFSTVSTKEAISINNTQNLPPNVAMQTAWIINSSAPFRFKTGGSSQGSSQGNKSLLMLYFAEVEKLNMSGSRSFYVTINGETQSETITVVPNYSATELTISLSDTYDYTFQLVKAPNSTNPPIINAYEYYSLVDTQQATDLQDIEALNVIKKKFDIKDWISDPCYLIQWEGIDCDVRSSNIRISQIHLSEKNLTGSIPDDFGQFTGLISLSLDNNHLIGPLPNLSNLTLLERIHLNNNSLDGTVPDWLSDLKNLKELFIENNNFSGVIPKQLLQNPSLKLRYSGNPYLCMHKGECMVLSNPSKDKARIVLGLTIPGALILMVCIAVYWKKSRTKQHMNNDHCMIMARNPTMSPAFSQQEMMAATKNFSRKIGQGGFGSVFYGKLVGGKDVAVKVLSVFSPQGVQQFLNEVDLLSRVHHKNLVSLLGCCNESRGLMLIYEHMSGGSLSEGLYGCSARFSKLNWKTRLKIVLDAAQGLEYLHVGCTPKIIHRDIKPSNILLDSNLNGKLADFGISRSIIDGEAGHVTTLVKGTAGYLDPEYFNTQRLTEKSDVYSFGVVLLEIICGRPPINSKLPEDELSLVRWATRYVNLAMEVNPYIIAEIVDKRLGKNYDMKSMTHVAKLAIRCVEGDPTSRPTASEIVTWIREAIKLEADVSLDYI